MRGFVGLMQCDIDLLFSCFARNNFGTVMTMTAPEIRRITAAGGLRGIEDLQRDVWGARSRDRARAPTARGGGRQWQRARRIRSHRSAARILLRSGRAACG